MGLAGGIAPAAAVSIAACIRACLCTQASSRGDCWQSLCPCKCVTCRHLRLRQHHLFRHLPLLRCRHLRLLLSGWLLGWPRHACLLLHLRLLLLRVSRQRRLPLLCLLPCR